MMVNPCAGRAPHEGHTWRVEGHKTAVYICYGLDHQPLNQLDLEGENAGRAVD